MRRRGSDGWYGARESGAAARYLIRREIGWRSAILSSRIRFVVFARMTADVLGGGSAMRRIGSWRFGRLEGCVEGADGFGAGRL
jgi:broad specificity phosphatase PhoE